jgi:hypothetical protein
MEKEEIEEIDGLEEDSKVISKIEGLPVKSFRKIPDPVNEELSRYIFYVNVFDVPEGIPMQTNPRDQKLAGGIKRAIEESLGEVESKFHLKNRGMLLSADRIAYDNKENLVDIYFSNYECHGDIDGGHTYKLILECKKASKIVGEEHYIMFEVVTGVEDFIDELAESRNTSNPVDTKSIEELKNNFNIIKNILSNSNFLDRVQFKQNQYIYEDKNIIDAREVVAILNMFNLDLYPNNPNVVGFSHPIQSYNSKEASLKRYLKNMEHYKNLERIAIDIFNLWDFIECNFSDYYVGKYGRKRYSKYNSGNVIGKSLFGDKDLKYSIPKGIMYPLVGAFRALITFDEEGKYVWKNNVNPIKFFEDNGKMLTEKIIEACEGFADNPNAVGKSNNTWDLMFTSILIKSM